MTSMLAPILAATRHRIAHLPSLDEVRAMAAAAPPARDLMAALREPGLSVIAEIKRRSPSAGDIDVALEPVRLAQSYVTGGAAAISVLTEPDHFAGSLDDLAAVREVVDVPVVRKDFTLDVRQIFEARAYGADAVLLIVAALDDDTLADLLRTAAEAECAALVEVHDHAELVRALHLGARLIGVNNRDLTSFRTDLGVAESLADAAAQAEIAVAESGVSDAAGASRMRGAGYDAILVGEALVRAPDPAHLIRTLQGLDG